MNGFPSVLLLIPPLREHTLGWEDGSLARFKVISRDCSHFQPFPARQKGLTHKILAFAHSGSATEPRLKVGVQG